MGSLDVIFSLIYSTTLLCSCRPFNLSMIFSRYNWLFTSCILGHYAKSHVTSCSSRTMEIKFGLSSLEFRKSARSSTYLVKGRLTPCSKKYMRMILLLLLWRHQTLSVEDQRLLDDDAAVVVIVHERFSRRSKRRFECVVVVAAR